MGLLDELGYDVKSPNGLQRLVQRVASSRPGAWLLSKTADPVDKALFRMTDGRLTVPGLMVGVSMIMLTTTGAKSGKARTNPLLGIPLGDNLAVIGSNYGQRSTPAWVYNLEGDKSATVGYRDKTVMVTARRADEKETNQVFDRAVSVYPGYANYRTRASHRSMPAFVLEACHGGASL